MKDHFGNSVTTYVVSAKVWEKDGTQHLTLTLVLKSRMEFKKVEINKSVFSSKPEDLALQVGETEFGVKTESVRTAVLGLAAGDKNAGKFFFKEAITAYGATEKLRPDQIVDAVRGALLVDRVSQL